VYAGLIGDAVRARVRASKRRAERQLRRLGVKLRPARVRATLDDAGQPATPAPLGGKGET
jgi:hypothetical protein